ncbi:MAG: arsenate reductase/protein-tyrosine-phosphatase family protein [Candidatus Kariarchaeaceae archaeon]
MDERLEDSLKEAKEIIFLCSGNIIRSAFAHIYGVNKGFKQKIHSAGTKYWNTKIFDKTKLKLIEMGITEVEIDNFHPTHISETPFDKLNNPIYFGMKSEHLKDLDKYDIPYTKRFLLTEIIGKETDIQDPYFEGSFEDVFSLIKLCVDTLYETTK